MAMDERITVFGIKNCDTVRKARQWLDDHAIAHDFHDFKTAGVRPDALAAWIAKWGWERVLNKAGTTYRKLPDEAKSGLTEAKAIKLMLANPSMIKRPIVTALSPVLLGFDAEQFALFFHAVRA